MKILFFSPLFYPHIGGVEKHVAEVSATLIKKGCDVTVVTEQYNNRLPLSEEKNGFRILRIPFMKENKRKKFRIWWWLLRNRGIIKDADIVHCHDVFFWYLPFRFLYPFKPVFTTFHGYETSFPPSQKAIFMRRISNFLSKGSINIGHYIEKFYGTRPNVVLYGGISKIQNSKLKVKSRKSKLRILLVGRLSEDIGVNEYLEAIEILRKKGVKVQFEAIGDGPLKAQVQNAGKVYGFVAKPGNSIKGADVILASSYLSILEALSWHKPVIAVYANPLKESSLKDAPFSRFIATHKNGHEVAKSIPAYKKLQKSLNTADLDAFLSKVTWEKVTEAYLKLWKKI